MNNLSHAVRFLSAVAILFGASALVLNVALAIVRSAAPAEASFVPAPRSKSRCAECGRITARDAVAAASGAQAVRYEYTVRMTDGSTRVFQEPAEVHWRLGEHLVVID
jgi:hypothetical protein